MRRTLLIVACLTACLPLASCGGKGVVHLSINDFQQGQQLLMQEDELFTKAVAAMARMEYEGSVNREEVLSVYKESREYLDRSDEFVKKMYEKYGVSEEDYRLDVFGGAFMPKVK